MMFAIINAHPVGINWEGMLTTVSLIAGLLVTFAALMGRMIKGARSFVGNEVHRLTNVLSDEVTVLDKRTTRMSYAGIAAILCLTVATTLMAKRP